MSTLTDNLRKRFCPETAGDIILALEEADCEVDYGAPNLDGALVWMEARQGQRFWSGINDFEYNRKEDQTLDIYSLKRDF